MLNADAYPILQPPLIQQYLDANGIIMGKTNLAEMQDTITSIQPTANGINTPLNPYDPTRIAGGEPKTFRTLGQWHLGEPLNQQQGLNNLEYLAATIRDGDDIAATFRFAHIVSGTSPPQNVEIWLLTRVL